MTILTSRYPAVTLHQRDPKMHTIQEEPYAILSELSRYSLNWLKEYFYDKCEDTLFKIKTPRSVYPTQYQIEQFF